jgi:hypothetical protein
MHKLPELIFNPLIDAMRRIGACPEECRQWETDLAD